MHNDISSNAPPSRVPVMVERCRDSSQQDFKSGILACKKRVTSDFVDYKSKGRARGHRAPTDQTRTATYACLSSRLCSPRVQPKENVAPALNAGLLAVKASSSLRQSRKSTAFAAWRKPTCPPLPILGSVSWTALWSRGASQRRGSHRLRTPPAPDTPVLSFTSPHPPRI